MPVGKEKVDRLYWAVQDGETRVEAAPSSEGALTLQVRTEVPENAGYMMVRGVTLSRRQALGLAIELIHQANMVLIDVKEDEPEASGRKSVEPVDA